MCDNSPGICLAWMRKNRLNLIHDSWSPGRDLNPEPPEYGTGAITSPPRRWVRGSNKRKMTRMFSMFKLAVLLPVLLD
jgi:hypothetical protein